VSFSREATGASSRLLAVDRQKQGVVNPKSIFFAAGNKKIWRVFTAVSALPDRSTFVRLSKTNVAQIQTLKTQQLKNKPTPTLKRRLWPLFVDDGRSHERNANRIHFNHCTVRFRFDQTGQDTGATQSATRSIAAGHMMP
jgi:hypothetical protein